MQMSKEETFTLAMETILMGAAHTLMLTTRNPFRILQIANAGINAASKGEEENAPTTKDQGGD